MFLDIFVMVKLNFINQKACLINLKSWNLNNLTSIY